MDAPATTGQDMDIHTTTARRGRLRGMKWIHCDGGPGRAFKLDEGAARRLCKIALDSPFHNGAGLAPTIAWATVAMLERRGLIERCDGAIAITDDGIAVAEAARQAHGWAA